MLSCRRVYTFDSGHHPLGSKSGSLGSPRSPFITSQLVGAGGLITITGTKAGSLDHGGNVRVNGGYFLTVRTNRTAKQQRGCGNSRPWMAAGHAVMSWLSVQRCRPRICLQSSSLGSRLAQNRRSI